MSDNSAINNSFSSRLFGFARENLKKLLILLALLFSIFLFLQIYFYYSSNKIYETSINFFNIKNLEEPDEIEKTYISISKQNNFYSTLAKVELIKIYIDKKKYDEVSKLYSNILNDENLEKVYISALASKASYQFIDLSFENLSLNFLQDIENFISYISEDLETYKGIKLELNYLAKILYNQKNGLEYNSSQEISKIYNNIVSSESISPSIKDRVKKIHEFYIYK